MVQDQELVSSSKPELDGYPRDSPSCPNLNSTQDINNAARDMTELSGDAVQPSANMTELPENAGAQRSTTELQGDSATRGFKPKSSSAPEGAPC